MGQSQSGRLGAARRPRSAAVPARHLLGFASHTDPDGRRSYPSIETVAWYARKKERQVREDVKELRRLGLLIVAADQSPVAHIRGDRRPVVYELPLHLKRPVPNFDTGCAAPHAVEDTPSESRGAPQGSTGCAPASDGVRHSAPKEDRNNPSKKDSAGASSSSAATPQQRSPKKDDEDVRQRKIDKRKQTERAAAKRKVMERAGVDGELADALLDYLIDERAPGNLSAYIDGMPDDDLEERMEEATWEIQAERDDESRRAKSAQNLTEQVARNHPEVDADRLERFRATYAEALRRGHDSDTLVNALNAARDDPWRDGDIVDCYISALNEVMTEAAA